MIFGDDMSDPAKLGKNYIQECKSRFERGEDQYIFVSIPHLYERGWHPDFDLIKTYQDQADIVIAYPHYATDEERGAYKALAEKLSHKYEVLLYEISIEAGGGADAEIIQKVAFVYQHFQPIFDLGVDVAVGVLGGYIYDLIKGLYQSKKNPILINQYTIKRASDGVTYNYVFDGLTADEAIEAGKLIPQVEIEMNDSYHDVYLRYVPKLGKWIQFEV